MAKAAAKVVKPLTKSEIQAKIAEKTGLTKKQVNEALDALSDLICESVSKKGAGAFVLPGLFKVDKKEVPAQKAKKGVKVLGKVMDIPAKPASCKVRIRPLKGLKDVVAK